MSVELDDIVDVEAEYEEFLSQRPPLLRGRSNELENDDIEDDEQEQEQEEEGGEEGGGEEEAEDEMMAAAHQPNTQQKSNKVLVASRVVSLASSSPHSYTKEVLFGIAELVR